MLWRAPGTECARANGGAIAHRSFASHLPSSNRGETQLQNGPNPGEAIFRYTNLFSLRKRARHVIDRKFYRDVAFAHQLDDQLNVEIESVAHQVKAEQRVAPEHFE